MSSASRNSNPSDPSPYGWGNQSSAYQGNYPQGGYEGFHHGGAHQPTSAYLPRSYDRPSIANRPNGRGADDGAGPYAGKGPRGYRRTDEAICEDANQCLCDHSHIDAENIEVTVDRGEVVLTGTVCDRSMKRLCEDHIYDCVSGVRDIINQIKVQA